VGKAGVVVGVGVGVVRFLLFILCGWWVGSNFEEDVKEMVERCLAVEEADVEEEEETEEEEEAEEEEEEEEELEAKTVGSRGLTQHKASVLASNHHRFGWAAKLFNKATLFSHRSTSTANDRPASSKSPRKRLNFISQ
jgi:uncharacterized membrane protein YgaE (UPF0421/DUF939 family)